MWGGERNREHADGPTDALFFDECCDVGNDRAPTEIGFDSVQNEEPGAAFVAAGTDLEGWKVQLGVVIARKPQPRTTRAVIEEGVDVELGDQLMFDRREDVVGCEPHCGTGLEEAGKPVDEHRVLELR